MFNLPSNDNPEELLRLFDFENNIYEVCFEIIEKKLWFFGGRVEKVKRFYIASSFRLVPEQERRYLTHYYSDVKHFRYSFSTQGELDHPSTSRKVLYWGNSTDPVNLLTFLKGRLDKDAQGDFVVFSSSELN